MQQINYDKTYANGCYGIWQRGNNPLKLHDVMLLLNDTVLLLGASACTAYFIKVLLNYLRINIVNKHDDCNHQKPDNYYTGHVLKTAIYNNNFKYRFSLRTKIRLIFKNSDFIRYIFKIHDLNSATWRFFYPIVCKFPRSSSVTSHVIKPIKGNPVTTFIHPPEYIKIISLHNGFYFHCYFLNKSAFMDTLLLLELQRFNAIRDFDLLVLHRDSTFEQREVLEYRKWCLTRTTSILLSRDTNLSYFELLQGSRFISDFKFNHTFLLDNQRWPADEVQKSINLYSSIFELHSLIEMEACRLARMGDFSLLRYDAGERLLSMYLNEVRIGSVVVPRNLRPYASPNRGKVDFVKYLTQETVDSSVYTINRIIREARIDGIDSYKPLIKQGMDIDLYFEDKRKRLLNSLNNPLNNTLNKPLHDLVHNWLRDTGISERDRLVRTNIFINNLDKILINNPSSSPLIGNSLNNSGSGDQGGLGRSNILLRNLNVGLANNQAQNPPIYRV